jgi:hypothetical protein
MDVETFQNLNPEIHRLVRLILNGEATEVQINFVLKTNDLDRKTLDEAIGFIKNMEGKFRRLSFFFVVVLFVLFSFILGLLL